MGLYSQYLHEELHPYLLTLHSIEQGAIDVFRNNSDEDEDVQKYHALMSKQNQQTLDDLFKLLSVTNEAIISAMEKVRLFIKAMPKDRRDKVGQLLESKGYFTAEQCLYDEVDVHMRDEEESIDEALDCIARKDVVFEGHTQLQEKYSDVVIPKPPSRTEWIVRRYLAVHGGVGIVEKGVEVGDQRGKIEAQELLLQQPFNPPGE